MRLGGRESEGWWWWRPGCSRLGGGRGRVVGDGYEMEATGVHRGGWEWVSCGVWRVPVSASVDSEIWWEMYWENIYQVPSSLDLYCVTRSVVMYQFPALQSVVSGLLSSLVCEEERRFQMLDIPLRSAIYLASNRANAISGHR